MEILSIDIQIGIWTRLGPAYWEYVSMSQSLKTTELRSTCIDVPLARGGTRRVTLFGRASGEGGEPAMVSHPSGWALTLVWSASCHVPAP